MAKEQKIKRPQNTLVIHFRATSSGVDTDILKAKVSKSMDAIEWNNQKVKSQDVTVYFYYLDSNGQEVAADVLDDGSGTGNGVNNLTIPAQKSTPSTIAKNYGQSDFYFKFTKVKRGKPGKEDGGDPQIIIEP